eukprot:jgi/Tetstr1/428802/TSEL_018789.t1
MRPAAISGALRTTALRARETSRRAPCGSAPGVRLAIAAHRTAVSAGAPLRAGTLRPWFWEARGAPSRLGAQGNGGGAEGPVGGDGDFIDPSKDIRLPDPAAQPPPQEAARSWSQQVGDAVRVQLAKMDGLWHKFVPMVVLFFCMAFINTIVDSLKDTIIVTAPGSGPHVIPFLTVYGTLPSAIIFLVLFSAASQRFEREQLFNGVVTMFISFFALFACFLYPCHQSLHLTATGSAFMQALPSGLEGLVCMVQNWTFTLFYIAAELWGDVGLSLLFWGLANEITTHDEAPVIYPLFGVGANIAQVIAGRFLGSLGQTTSALGSVGAQAEFAVQLRFVLGAVAAMGVVVLVVHNYVCRAGLDKSVAAIALDKSMDEAAARKSAHTSPQRRKALKALRKAEKAQPSLRKAVVFLAKSPQIRCLAIMALAQGICTNLMDITWKTHLRLLCPSPTEYAAFMGNVASCTGIVTGVLMLASPVLFQRLGWGGVASTTPTLLFWGGVPFFAAAVFYNLFASGLTYGPATLQAVVVIGAILYVVCRGAKFSLFKPAEEMVYIGLDEESRTKGKAAIDVVGAQTGKSLSSGLQQLLMLLGGGQLGFMLPVMGGVFITFLTQWKKAVRELATNFMEPRSAEEKVWPGITVDEEMLGPTAVKKLDDEIAVIMSQRGNGEGGGDDGPPRAPAISPA